MNNKELTELAEYAILHGRNWKSKLLYAWIRPISCNATLQHLRNTLGPSGLKSLNLLKMLGETEGMEDQYYKLVDK